MSSFALTAALERAQTWGFEAVAVEKALRMARIATSLSERMPSRVAVRGSVGLQLYGPTPPVRLPRDLDVYVRSGGREARDLATAAMESIAEEYDSIANRVGQLHDKWTLAYDDCSGQRRFFCVDLVFRNPIALWFPRSRTGFDPLLAEAPVLSPEELVAEKLVAMVRRTDAVDVFDACRAALDLELDRQRVRTAFVVALLVSPTPSGPVPAPSRILSALQLRRLPVHFVPSRFALRMRSDPMWSRELLDAALPRLDDLLTLGQEHREFLARAVQGSVCPDMIASDDSLADRIEELLANHSTIARPIAPPARRS